MVVLSRTVRFAINPDGATDGCNGYAGIPAIDGLGRFYELVIRCAGQPDPLTGYLVDIRAIDQAVRDRAVPLIADARLQGPAELLGPILETLARSEIGPTLDRLVWNLSPYHALEISVHDRNTAHIRTSVDLAAAHRLHSDALSAEENRAIFGKCNNPNGHGHNYRVEADVSLPIGPGRRPLGFAQLERILIEEIVRRFDHKHLNLDTPEFASGSGRNPSVENMAQVFFELLAPRIADAHPDATLAFVTVWETDRTSATFAR